MLQILNLSFTPCGVKKILDKEVTHPLVYNYLSDAVRYPIVSLRCLQSNLKNTFVIERYYKYLSLSYKYSVYFLLRYIYLFGIQLYLSFIHLMFAVSAYLYPMLNT